MRRVNPRRLAAWLAPALLVLPGLCGGCGDTDPPSPVRPAYDTSGRALFRVERPATLPNLIVVVIDSLRHDALPLEDGTEPDARMPHLASLASRGVAFSNAVAASPWTLPSMTSLLTGLQPSAHGLSAPQSRVRLVEAITTWAEILRGAYGYDTVAHTAGHWFQGSGESILQGFDRTHADFSFLDAESELWRWSHYRTPGRPFFLLLHTYDVHDPYGEANHPWRGEKLPDVTSDPSLFGPQADPGEIFRQCFLDAGTVLALREAMGSALVGVLHRYAHSGYAAAPRPELAADLAGAYWGGVHWTDGLLARTTAFLGREGLLENTLLVVTSDHGEGFGEHGSLGHGRLLYDELIQVPLVMAGPKPFAGGQRVTSGVGLVDILPTFFDWAGLEPQTGIEGRSILTLLEEDQGCRPVLSEERLSFLNTGEPQDVIRLSARTEHWKYVVTYDAETGAAYEEVSAPLTAADEADDLGGGTGRLPPELVFDDCFCEAVEALRNRIWDDAAAGAEVASQVPYGTTNRQPTTPPPTPCVGHVE